MEDLIGVRDAARLLGVHENTVRNWAKRGRLREVLVPGTTRRRFPRSEVLELAESLERQQRRKGAAQLQIGPDLLDAEHLVAWADRPEARTRLAELVSRLLHATDGLSEISVRTGGGTDLPEVDGSARSMGTSILPSGHLDFEFSTRKDIKRKAEEDLGKRAPGPGRQESHLLVVTLRRWASKNAWATDATRRSGYSSVRVLDADDLAAWLQRSPAVHHWLSEIVNRGVSTSKSLQSWWDQTFAAARFPVPHELFVSGRFADADLVRRHVESDADDAQSLTVQGGSVGDVIGFMFGTLQGDPRLLNRAMVVADADEYRRVIQHTTRLIVVTAFDDLRGVNFPSEHRVIVARGRDSHLPKDALTLPALHTGDAADSLRDAGVDFDNAFPLAGIARRSFDGFLRSISAAPSVLPMWASGSHAKELSMLALVCTWTAEDGDVSAIERITGVPWPRLETHLKGLARTEDPPFVESGGAWTAASHAELVERLKHFYTPRDMQRFRKVLVDVLLEPDPLDGLNESERIRAQIDGQHRMYTATMRKGMARGLAAIGATSGSLDSDALGSVQTISGELLTKGFASVMALAALSESLPLLAEAAPRDFLSALRADLDKSEPVTPRLFRDEDAAFPFGNSSPHTWLLWALETLCWNDDHFADATDCLARLAAIDPGGRLSNRPQSSLASVFTAWVRHTAATVETRLDSLVRLTHAMPDVGWNLLMDIWPENHATALPPAKPTYRDWAPDSSSVPLKEWHDVVDRVVTLALELAEGSPGRWSEIVEKVGTLPPDLRHKAISALRDAVASQAFEDSNPWTLWEALRETIASNRKFADADWAMAESAVAALDSIKEDLEPLVGIERYAHLFSSRWEIDEWSAERNYDTLRTEVTRRRDEAASELYHTGGLDAVLELCRAASSPSTLGQALAGSRDHNLDGKIVPLLEATNEPERQFAAAYVRRCLDEGGPDALVELLAHGSNEEQRLSIVLSIPVDDGMWTFLNRLPEQHQDEFWKRVPSVFPNATLEESVEALLQFDRCWAAVDTVSMSVHDQSPATDKSAALANTVLESLYSSGGAAEDEPTDMSRYALRVLLDVASQQSTDLDRLARYEFMFFRFLEHTRRPSALFRKLAEDPSAFVELASLAYRPDDPSSASDLDANGQASAQLAWTVLHKWSTLPGHVDGVVDEDQLRSWVSDARRMFFESGREQIGDYLIGEVLATAPAGEDAHWPHEFVRQLVEDIGNTYVMRGMKTAKYNSRGVTTRSPFDGGAQERAIAQQFRDDAAAMSGRWPRTARALHDLADSYEQDARRNDRDAERTSDGLR